MVIMGSKHVFWQALIFTIIIFGIGLIFGYYLESSRLGRVELNLLGSEISLLDEQMRGRIVGEYNLSCDLAKASTFTFADKIYDDAAKLEEYEASSKFTTETLREIHKRYDLLRTMLWEESIGLKSRCQDFHTVVYFFNYASDDIDLRAKQEFFSRLLVDVKNNHPDEILLIPIAANLDLASVELAIENYNISETPAILIDENKVVSDIVTLDEMENFIFQDNSNSTSHE